MAYFGDWLDEDSSSQEAAVCDAMVQAALEIHEGFHNQLEAILSGLQLYTLPKQRPNPKTVISYDSVLWVVLGSENFMDLTILTDSVVRAARVMQHKQGRNRLVGPGDIYIMERVGAALTPNRVELEPLQEIELRDFEREIIRVQRVTGVCE